MNFKIRDAKTSDAKEILKIYAYYVEHTAITFEYDVPTLEDFQNRIRNIMIHYPYLVVENDGAVTGFAYAKAFVERAAYKWSCEVSIYIDHSLQKSGLGGKLYKALEKRLKEIGILNLYACIAYPIKEDEFLNRNSTDFHAHLGFAKVGEFYKCGYKFGRWYNMIWMEKIIGTHKPKPNTVLFSIYGKEK